MRVLVTVGSTQFDLLIAEILSGDVPATLRARGYTTMTVQAGNSTIPLPEAHGLGTAPGDKLSTVLDGLEIKIWRFKPSLDGEIAEADLVISHAGSGTIIDVLRTPRPLIVVPNTNLLDNHQQELAQALHDRGHLCATAVEDLASTLRTFDSSKLVPFPAFDGTKFQSLIDEEMGL